MTVAKGDIIYAIDDQKELEVEGLWGDDSSIVDFSAKYITSTLVDNKGHRVFGNRGFKFEDENVKWKKVAK